MLILLVGFCFPVVRKLSGVCHIQFAASNCRCDAKHVVPGRKLSRFRLQTGSWIVNVHSYFSSHFVTPKGSRSLPFVHCHLKAIHVCHCLAVIWPTDHVKNCSSVTTHFVCWMSCAASLLPLLFLIASLVSPYSVHEFRRGVQPFWRTVSLNRTLCNNVSVPVQSYCGTAVRTGNWVMCCGSSVGHRSISAPVGTVKVSLL